jgi:hypothetical protein
MGEGQSDGRGGPVPPQGKEPVECRLVAVKQPLTGVCVEMALEQLLLLRGVESGPGAFDFARQQGPMAVDRATKWLVGELLRPLVEGRQKDLKATLPQRLEFLQRGFAYHEAELAIERTPRGRPKGQASAGTGEGAPAQPGGPARAGLRGTDDGS